MNNYICGPQPQNSSFKSSKIEDPLYSAIIANIVFSGFLCYTTIVLNIVTIHALRKTSALSKPLKTFLLSLAASDLGVGFLGQPINVAYLVAFLRCNLSNHNHTTRIARRVVLDTFCLSSFFSIMALSTERFIAIQKPLRYQDVVTQKRVFTAVTAVWVFSAFLGVTFLFVLPDNISFVIFLIIEFVCFVSTTWSSSKIYLTARRHNMQIQVQAQQVSQNSDVANIASPKKSAQSTLLIYLAFWACYLPRSFIWIVRQNQISKTDAILGMLLYVLVLLNSSINPIIYCWTMRHIRHTIMGILRNIFRRQ